jgi:hypothetical protein
MDSLLRGVSCNLFVLPQRSRSEGHTYHNESQSSPFSHVSLQVSVHQPRPLPAAWCLCAAPTAFFLGRGSSTRTRSSHLPVGVRRSHIYTQKGSE